MKKILISIFIFLTFAFSVNGEEIDSFDTKIIINKDGTISVKETILYDFEYLQRHGIFRNINYIKTNEDGKKFKLDLTNFDVSNERGETYQFTSSTEDEKIKLKIGDPNRTISGLNTYVIDYQVKGALTYFSDHDELYWNITGNDWEIPINAATAEIMLPETIVKENLQLKCFTGVTGSTSENCQIDIVDNIVKIQTKNLSYNEGLTVVVGFPIDLVAYVEPKEVISFWSTIMGKIVIAIIVLLAILWYFILPAYIVFRWYFYGRDPKSTVGVTRAWFDPPKSPKSNRFLTPGEVGTLGDETVDLKDISAMIIDLARRGFLRIEERNKNVFYLVRRNLDKGGSLLPFEKLLIDKFFKTKTEIKLKDEQLYDEVEEVKKSLYEASVTEGLFPVSPESIRTKYYILAGVAMFTGNIILALSAFIFGRVMPRKTVEGVNAFNVATSLKNFLTSQERQLKFQASKQMMFEKLLPYAVAFGVEKIWAKRFEDMNLKQPDWYQSYSGSRFNSYLFANSLSSSMQSFRTSATPTRSSSGFSSGFSSGGGFSGGGGGGGGGGSW